MHSKLQLDLSTKLLYSLDTPSPPLKLEHSQPVHTPG